MEKYLQEKFGYMDLFERTYRTHDCVLQLVFGMNLEISTEGGAVSNRTYFEMVYKDMIDIFEEIFQEDDEMYFVTLLYKDYPLPKGHHKLRVFNRFIKMKNIVRQISYAKKDIELFGHKSQVTQYSLRCEKDDIRYKTLLKAICNQDFASLQPQLNVNGVNFTQFIFINKTRGILLDIYDDRGGFILASQKEDRDKFEEKYQDLHFKEEDMYISLFEN